MTMNYDYYMASSIRMVRGALWLYESINISPPLKTLFMFKHVVTTHSTHQINSIQLTCNKINVAL